MVVLYIVLALLLILLCSRYGVVLAYAEESFSIRLRFGFLTFHIPKLKKKAEKEQSPKTEEKKEERPQENKEQKKKKFSLPPWDQLPTLAGIALETLGRIFRSIRIDELTLHLSVGTDDPYNTAMALNYANAAAELILNSRLLKIGKQDVVIAPDFVNEKSEAEGQLSLSLRAYKLIAACLALLLRYWRWQRTQKKSSTEERI